MDRSAVILGMLLATGIAAEPAAGQVQFGAALSWGSETDLGLGGRLNFGLGELTKKSKVEGRVAFDYFFPNDFDYWQITGDALYQVASSGSAKPYLGGGVGYSGSSSSNGYVPPGARRIRTTEALTLSTARLLGYGTDSHFFLGLIGGLQFPAIGNIRPFGEARFQFGNGSQVVLTGGVNFGRH